MNLRHADLDHRWCRPPLEAFYLTGPTASGKTPLALEVAQRLNAEIISMDSMAVYRGMDIGTAKPSNEQRASVPHHLLDIVEPTEAFSVSCFVEAATSAAKEIRERGKQVLLVGGTPLYLKCLMRGLFLGPPADEQFRSSVEEDARQHGLESLRNRLEQVDPLLAHKLHPNDSRRMIRALEVARSTGKPLSHWQTQFETPAFGLSIRAVVLGLDRAWLHSRINQRVMEMVQRGLVDEVRELLERHGNLGSTASQAVGYREVLDHFEGTLDFDSMIAEIQAHTRQFARRQEIWFRGLEELRRIEVNPDSNPNQLVDEITEQFESRV